QYRLHHADRRRHRHPGRAYGRTARLGDRRPGAGRSRGDRNRRGSGAFGLKCHSDATRNDGRNIMAKSKKRKTKVKQTKRAVTARKTKTKKGKRPVKKTKPAKRTTKRKATKSVAKKSAPGKPKTYKILMMGAAYGSLLAAKMLFGGHKIHHVCLPAEAELINAEGF